MKTLLLALVLLPFLSDAQDQTGKKQDAVARILQQYTRRGVPGLVVAAYTPTGGYWGAAAGFSSLETNTPMRLSHLQYLQSATKMYMAVAILKLREKGVIDLDAPITRYLPERFSRFIDQASSMHVRHLLNHRSGMPDYLASPKYLTRVLQHPDHYFTSEELLHYIRHKKRGFPPGTRFDYSNSNFLVLALIVDSITGDHGAFIRKEILSPLHLSHTFYREIAGHPDLVDSYLDRFGTGVVENVTPLQQVSISFSQGDDGIIATPQDAIAFLTGLMEGNLLSDSSRRQMLTFIQTPDGTPIYGLGIYYLKYGDLTGYGHGGAGAGAGCGLYYFPEKKTYLFLGTNVGTLIDGPVTQKVNACKNEILSAILTDSASETSRR